MLFHIVFWKFLLNHLKVGASCLTQFFSFLYSLWIPVLLFSFRAGQFHLNYVYIYIHDIGYHVFLVSLCQLSICNIVPPGFWSIFSVIYSSPSLSLCIILPSCSSSSPQSSLGSLSPFITYVILLRILCKDEVPLPMMIKKKA